MIKRLYKFIKELLSSRNNISDSICLGEEVSIYLVKDGHTIQTIKGRGHTWQTDGLKSIRDWLCGLSANPPNQMWHNGTPVDSDNTVTITAQTEGDTIAIFSGSFGTSSSDKSGISKFALGYNGTTYSVYTNFTAFNKPTDADIIIDWRTTIGV